MSEQIEKFDPSTLMQGVKDRIKATFVSLIPDAQWDQMVQKEIDAFFDPNTSYSKKVTRTQTGGAWSSQYEKEITIDGKSSVFQTMVFEMCIDKTIEKLKAKLSNETLKDAWNFNKVQFDEGLKEIIAGAIPLGMTKLFEGISFAQMNQLRSQIQNFVR